jgi:hypothetical protein
MLSRGKASKLWGSGAALLALAALSLAVFSDTAAGAESGPPEPRFCERHTLHDYLAPLGRLPKLHEPPFRRTGRGFHFRGLEVAASGPSLAVSGGRVGYQLDWDVNPKFEVTVILWRVDRHGRVVQRMGQRRLRLGELAPAITTEPNFLLRGRPGVYRTAIVIRSRHGRKLTDYGNYYRVIRPSVHGRLAPISETFSPGDTLFARLEDPGAAFVLFGEEFEIEKLEGETWVPAGLPGAYSMPLYFVAPGTTSGHCTVFPIPTTTPPGRYRLSQEAIFSWPLQDHELRPMLRAEFSVVPPGKVPPAQRAAPGPSGHDDST